MGGGEGGSGPQGEQGPPSAQEMVGSPVFMLTS